MARFRADLFALKKLKRNDHAFCDIVYIWVNNYFVLAFKIPLLLPKNIIIL